MSQGQYDNSMRGALFANDRKTSPNHPDYRGSAEVDGQEYWVSAWIKEPRGGGKKYLSLAFTPKDENGSQGGGQPRRATNDAQDFLAQNKDKIDQHRSPSSPQQPPRAQPAPDYDSFDDDIPF